MLIAGSGHVRRDFGVPALLANYAAELRVTSIAFEEVREKGLEPKDYRSNPEIFDFLVFTPRQERADPCEKLRKHFE